MRNLTFLAVFLLAACGGSGGNGSSSDGSSGSLGGSGGGESTTRSDGSSSGSGDGATNSGGSGGEGGSAGSSSSAGSGAERSGGSGGSAGTGGAGGSSASGGSGGSGGDLCTDVDCAESDDPCLESSCDPETGGCVTEPVEDGTPCADDDLCNGSETCQSGSCQAGMPLDCDDENPCTDDTCDAESGCENDDNVSECDDGNPCTESDTCAEGSCVSGTNECSCEVDEDCQAFEDDSLCNGTLVCDDNECVVDAQTVVTCDTSEDTVCSATACDPDTGSCETNDLEGDCNDMDPCTFDDVCVAGACQGTEYACDDDLSCTNDICDGDGSCSFPLQTGCLIDDECIAQGQADPANECRTCRSNLSTTDYSNAPSATSCDDENACTFVDRCSAGSCGAADEPAWPDGQDIIIVSVSLSESHFVVRNVSGGNLDISDWAVCVGADDPYPFLPSDIPELGNGEEITIHVGASGIDDANNIYASGGSVLKEADELSLYVNGSFSNSNSIRVYLRYQRDGAGGGSSTRQGVATGHDPPLWTTGNVIQLDAGDDGFVAIGNVTQASGFATTSAACL